MADETGDKTEAPTARRRQEAREQGQVARSPDLTAAAILLSVMLLLHAYGFGLITALQALMSTLLSSATFEDRSMSSAGDSLLICVRQAAVAVAPILIGVALVAIIANLLQVGLFFNLERLKPNLAALNPVRGLGKIFSGSQGFVHFAMSLLKLFLVSAVAYSAVHAKLPLIVSTETRDFYQIFVVGAGLVYSLGLRVSSTLLILAIIDYSYQRYNNEQQLKMSKQDVKEELRNMEGDPKIKQRRRQLALQRLTKSIRKTVPTADVIVTNPTHYAVALKYDTTTMGAPRVVAKGADLLAKTIRELAIEHGVPILERPPLARALYRMVDVGGEIPEQFYSAVAEILAYVYELGGKMRLVARNGSIPKSDLSFVETN